MRGRRYLPLEDALIVEAGKPRRERIAQCAEELGRTAGAISRRYRELAREARQRRQGNDRNRT